MNIMGTVQPPMLSSRPMNPSEEFIHLCRGLSIALNSIAEVSQLQHSLIKNKSNNPIHNSGRIILFTSALIRSLEPLQEIMVKAIEECNKAIELNSKNE